MSRRLIVAVIASAAFAASAVAGAGMLDRQRLAACAASEGSVVSFSPSAGHACPGSIAFGLPFYQGETVHSGNPGQLTFHTYHLDRCIEFRDTYGSADILYPKTGIAIRHLRGKTWCRRLPTDKYSQLLTPGAVLKTTGTIFGIDSNKSGSVIKVTDGSISALSLATRTTITIKAGFQALVPLTGPPHAPTALKPDDADQEGDLFLRLSIISMGTAQPTAYLKQQRQTSLVVVGQDPAALKTEMPFLRGTKLQTLTAGQVATDPRIVLERAHEIQARTVLVVGEFSTVTPTLKTLAATIQSRLALIYAANDI
jgi:hypothetical protein